MDIYILKILVKKLTAQMMMVEEIVEIVADMMEAAIAIAKIPLLLEKILMMAVAAVVLMNQNPHH